MTRRTAHRTALIAAAAALVLMPTAPATGAAGPDTVPLPDASSPEGIASGPGTTFYAGSRADGSIYTGSLRTGEGENLVPGRPGAVAVGMQYDRRSRLLWVAGGATGTVTAYDTSTGAEVVRYQVPAAPSGRFLNDVDVTAGGVFVTDSLNAELVVVRLGRSAAQPFPADVELLPLTGDWDQSPTGNNANGIRALPGGDLLVVDQGALQRIDPETGVATRLDQTAGETLTGGDGLVLRGNRLYVVYGFGRDSIAEVRLDLRDSTFTVTGELVDDDLERPTTAVLVAGDLWAVNGKFTTTPTPTTFEVVRVDVR